MSDDPATGPRSTPSPDDREAVAGNPGAAPPAATAPDGTPSDDHPTATPDTNAADTAAEPEFGPSGYLPPRASARARKIVLRAPLGLQWVVGALLAGVAVVVAGVLWLTSSGPPAAPFEATATIAEVDDAVALEQVDTLLVLAGGPAVAFADLAEHDLVYCPSTGRVEGIVDGVAGTWHAGTGRGFGVESLARHPVVVHDGVAWVDPTRQLAGPRPADDREDPGCR